MFLRHLDATLDRQYRNRSRQVVVETEDRNGVGVRHLPQAEHHQQHQRSHVEAIGHSHITNHRRHRPRQAAHQRAVNRLALEVQAVEADVDDKTDHGKQRRQRIGHRVQQCHAGNTEDGREDQCQFQGDKALDQHAILGALHLDIDVTVDAVVEHATGRHNKGSADHCRQEDGQIDMPLGGQEETACHRKHVTENDPRFGDLDKVLKRHRVLPHFAIM